MTALCPHCRGDIGEEAALTRGRWWLHPAAAFYDGNMVPLPRDVTRTLYDIARANGDRVTHHDLPGVGEGALAYRVRMMRKALGETCPVVGERHVYRWAPVA